MLFGFIDYYNVINFSINKGIYYVFFFLKVIEIYYCVKVLVRKKNELLFF